MVPLRFIVDHLHLSLTFDGERVPCAFTAAILMKQMPLLQLYSLQKANM